MYIPIVFITDDNYALATSVAIESIIQNIDSELEHHIYILGINLSINNKKRFESQANSRVKIEVIELDNKYKDFDYSHPYISKALFYKFDIANILPEDKILYLDGDVIVDGSLKELFFTDIGDNYAGVVEDVILLHEKKWTQTVNTQSYFNAGVLLLNAKKIREENLYTKFIEELTTHNYPNSDQDVFNILFDKQVKFLSLKYNFINLYYLYENLKTGENKINDFNMTKEELQDYKQSSASPLIIHFAGDKPWNLKKGKKFEVWKKYFRKSPYKNERLKWQKNKKFFEFNFSSEEIKIRLFGIGFNFKKK